MDKSTEQIKNDKMHTKTTVINSTKNLIRYGIQLAMLNKLLSYKMMSEKEYHKVNEQLKSDYKVASY